MIEPAFSFTIPSLHDDIPLDCRIYHPRDFGTTLNRVFEKSHTLHGAVVAHPYAPLGGSFDDAVVLAVARCLLKEGYVVGTFNFRGASGSKGSTSWTGRAEREDYAAFAAFMVYYLSRLQNPDGSMTKLNTINQIGGDSPTSFSGAASSTTLLLAGYSYGSLVLSRLPSISTIVQRFEAAERGTSSAEIVLRARRLAHETGDLFDVPQSPVSSRGQQVKDPNSLSPTKARNIRPSPVIVGGEETDPSKRRRSRDSRRSLDVVRKSVEAPRRIKAHIRQRSSGQAKSTDYPTPDAKDPQPITPPHEQPDVSVRYLLISFLLPPLSHALVSPATLSTLMSTSKVAMDKSMGVGALHDPTLVLWGSTDPFTSSRRLRSWAEKLAAQAPALFTWKEFDKVGHFWREENALKAMTEAVSAWVKSDASI